MKIVATVQARVGSSRLPAKVLKPILGKPMLELQLERIRQSRLIDEVVVATSTKSQDDPVEELARQVGVGCFRGSEEDVLSRITGALKAFQAQIHVEFMGDSPLPDPLLIDSVIGFYLKNQDSYDYVSNALKITYPPGADVYVCPVPILLKAQRDADPAHRDLVGWHVFRSPPRYRICNLEAPSSFHHPDFHLEVDTQEDFEVISAIFEHFYPRDPGFGLGQVIEFLKAHPELVARNQHVERRWKAFRQVG